MKIESAKEFLDFLFPKHDRTSCSDISIENGFYSRNSDGFGRCTRCIHLEILNGTEIPEKVLEDIKNGNPLALHG